MPRKRNFPAGSWRLVRNLVTTVLFASSAAPGQTLSLKRLDAYIEQARVQWEVPGLAVALVQNDSIIFAKGYGARELGKPGRVDAHTLFAVASNTKAFTAALLGLLVDAGKLTWDDRVVQHLPGFQMYDPYVTRELNLVDLLTHRSGLPVFGGDHLWIGARLSREEIMRRLRFLPPSAPLRTKFQYQNLMYLVAGQIIPAVTDTSWDDFIQARLLAPLGMRETVTSIRFLAGRDNVATPHEMVAGRIAAIPYD
ncbi:MAG: beta-lactamase family protein, partial [candidate division KSB1 bacterium]|nr:beta-lactamase family protein [candidate division KSB1 bacterium]